MARRYFAVTALGGRLYIDGIDGQEPWDSRSLTHQGEAAVDLLVSRVGHRKALTVDELREALRESESGLPAVRVWVREGLDEAVRILWQEVQTAARKD